MFAVLSSDLQNTVDIYTHNRIFSLLVEKESGDLHVVRGRHLCEDCRCFFLCLLGHQNICKQEREGGGKGGEGGRRWRERMWKESERWGEGGGRREGERERANSTQIMHAHLTIKQTHLHSASLVVLFYISVSV